MADRSMIKIIRKESIVLSRTPTEGPNLAAAGLWGVRLTKEHARASATLSPIPDRRSFRPQRQR
eukprot:scaffold100611_cov33-Tisochrysis_lutea.AAC.1